MARRDKVLSIHPGPKQIDRAALDGLPGFTDSRAGWETGSAGIDKSHGSKDPGDVNAGSMALWSVGIDAETCALLDEVLEKGTSGFGRTQIIMALGNVKPPSDGTLKALTMALTDTAPFVPYHAAETLGRLGVATPAVVSGLKNLTSISTNDLTTLSALTALWELEKDSQSTTGPVFQILEKQLLVPLAPPIGGGTGGHGVNETEQIFMKGAGLLRQIGLSESEKAKALALSGSFLPKVRPDLYPNVIAVSNERTGFSAGQVR